MSFLYDIEQAMSKAQSGGSTVGAMDSTALQNELDQAFTNNGAKIATNVANDVGAQLSNAISSLPANVSAANLLDHHKKVLSGEKDGYRRMFDEIDVNDLTAIKDEALVRFSSEIRMIGGALRNFRQSGGTIPMTGGGFASMARVGNTPFSVRTVARGSNPHELFKNLFIRIFNEIEKDLKFQDNGKNSDTPVAGRKVSEELAKSVGLTRKTTTDSGDTYYHKDWVEHTGGILESLKHNFNDALEISQVLLSASKGFNRLNDTVNKDSSVHGHPYIIEKDGKVDKLIQKMSTSNKNKPGVTGDVPEGEFGWDVIDKILKDGITKSDKALKLFGAIDPIYEALAHAVAQATSNSTNYNDTWGKISGNKK